MCFAFGEAINQNRSTQSKWDVSGVLGRWWGGQHCARHDALIMVHMQAQVSHRAEVSRIRASSLAAATGSGLVQGDGERAGEEVQLRLPQVGTVWYCFIYC
jgi:hypothetical protein